MAIVAHLPRIIYAEKPIDYLHSIWMFLADAAAAVFVFAEPQVRNHATAATAGHYVDMGDEEFEQTLCIIETGYVYKIPPRPSASGHR